MGCVRKDGSMPTFDPDRILAPDRIAASRRATRNKPTPSKQLNRKVNQLFRLCVQRLPKAFADNRVGMDAFIELSHPYAVDVVNAVIARFEKAEFKVVYTFTDEDAPHDRLSFTLPADWIERLLSFDKEAEQAMDRAVQSLVNT